MLKKNQIKYNYFLIGFVFGLFFVFGGLVTDIILQRKIEFNFQNIIYVYKDNLLHSIILCAPLVLGFTFYLIGIQLQKAILFSNKVEQSNKDLSNIIEVLDTFNYNVAHDLKSNMFNNKALLTMLEKYMLAGKYEKVNEIVDKLKYISEKSINTVLGFIDIAKLDRILNTQKDVVTCVVKTIVLELMEELQITKQSLNLNFDTSVEISFNSVLLNSIVKNILTNSVKYKSLDRELSIKINAKKIGNKLALEFIDNGIGMDLAKEKRKLFQPFSRLSNVSNIEGSGIGLYNINKIINTFGGTINVESELGKGTKFSITLYDFNINA